MDTRMIMFKRIGERENEQNGDGTLAKAFPSSHTNDLLLTSLSFPSLPPSRPLPDQHHRYDPGVWSAALGPTPTSPPS